MAGVVAVAALAWAYLFYLAWDMRQDMSQGIVHDVRGEIGIKLQCLIADCDSP